MRKCGGGKNMGGEEEMRSRKIMAKFRFLQGIKRMEGTHTKRLILEIETRFLMHSLCGCKI